MLRALLLIATATFGTNTFAQTIEERLTECIAESQRFVKYAIAWRTSLENIGERANPSDFAVIAATHSIQDLLRGTIESLETNNDPQIILKDIEQAAEPIFLRTELIQKMVNEAFSERQNFDAMAEYISACKDNFGGETYKLQDVIEELEIALSQANKDKDTLKAKLEKQISDLTNRLDTTALLLENSKAKLSEYEQTIIDLKGFDTVAYLDGLVKMGALKRNKEIYEGKFSKAKFETAGELSCLSKLRDKGQLNAACKKVLSNILNETLYND